jgi:hypothetical protein
MKFVLFKKKSPIDVWCVLQTPNLTVSGCIIAKFDGFTWISETGDEVDESHITGWCIIENN